MEITIEYTWEHCSAGFTFLWLALTDQLHKCKMCQAETQQGWKNWDPRKVRMCGAESREIDINCTKSLQLMRQTVITINIQEICLLCRKGMQLWMDITYLSTHCLL